MTMQLSTSSCNPACQERRSITHALLRAAVPMRFVTAGCKPAKQERRTKSINVRAALTLGLRPHKSGAAPNPCFFFTFSMWNQALATVLCTFCRPHLPKVFRDPQFIEIVKSLVHILPPSSSKSAPNMPIFKHFEVQIKLSLQSCALFVDNFCRSSPKPAETRPYCGDPRSHIARPKKHRVSRPSVFTRELTRFRTVALPSYLVMGGWHDDVADMMIRLTWWWDC